MAFMKPSSYAFTQPLWIWSFSSSHSTSLADSSSSIGTPSLQALPTPSPVRPSDPRPSSTPLRHAQSPPSDEPA